MSKRIDDGGPAFPVPLAATNNVHGEPIIFDSQDRCIGGMTLRDWFAGQAVPEALRQWRMSTEDRRYRYSRCVDLRTIESRDMPRFVANMAYEIADAMIAARKGESK